MQKKQKKKKEQATAKQITEVSEKNKTEKSEDASEKKKVKKKKKKKGIKANTNIVEKLDLDAAEAVGAYSENHIDKLETPANLEEVGSQSKEGDVKKTSGKKRKKKGRSAPANTKKTRYDKASYHGTNQTEEKEVDISSWLSIYTPEPVTDAIAKLGFSEPTEIQVRTSCSLFYFRW